MLCRKCKKEIADDSVYCNYCGIKQIAEQRRARRGNGEGTVFKAQNGTWAAEVTVGWYIEDGGLRRKSRRKSGFKTKKEAIDYIPTLRMELPQIDPQIQFCDIYERWLDRHKEKVGKSTIDCYKAAYKYLSDIRFNEMAKIKTEHIQRCIDACPHGTRTKENMKALCTCLFRYAMEQDVVEKNYAEYVYIKRGEKNERKAFTSDQIAKMWAAVDTVPNIKYVLVLCYTGLRLGEFLGAKTADLHMDDGYFIAGSKTEAGRNRIVPISPKILPFFDEFGKGEYLFTDNGRKAKESKFRESVFYSSLQAVGMDEIDKDGNHVYTPHCCRHTFASLMKNVDAPATDKQKLIGHASFEMTAHYTHTDIESLKKITDKL